MQKTCKYCGAQLHGIYCHECGEKVLTSKDKSIKLWVNDTVSNLLQFDGKLIKSISYLIIKPPKLAENYFEGIRKPYLKAINLFLIANLLYFLLPSFNTFKTNLYIQENQQIYSEQASRIVDRYLVNHELSKEEFRVKYDAKTTEISKLILVILAPFLGLFIYSLYYKRIYLTDAFNLGLQFWAAFILLYLTPLSLIIFAVRNWLSELDSVDILFSESFLSLTALLFGAIYFWFLLKWLKERVVFKIVKILVLILSFAPILIVYRWLLFHITMLTL